MKLSFGMIFSIILIIIFIAFAFYVIKTFLGTGITAQAAAFKDDIQNDVNKLWSASQGSQEEEYFLPNKIEYVCFVDYYSTASGAYSEIYEELKLGYYGSENLFFYPSNELSGIELKHVAIEDITSFQNPYCIPNTDSRVKIILNKDFNETLVTVAKQNG